MHPANNRVGLRALIVVVVTAILVVAAGSAWRNVRLARAANAALVVVERKRAAAGEAVRGVEVRFAEAEKNRVKLQAEFDRRQKTKGSMTGAAASRPHDPATLMEQLRAMIQKQQEAEKDPRIQLLQLAVRRAKMAATFGLLFRTLGLMPGQIEKFEDNATRREEQQMDLWAVMHEQGLTLQDPALAKLFLEIEPEYQAAQKELLGEAGYRKFQAYERVASMRDTVSRFAGVATVMGMPFTSSQAGQLAQILAGASNSYRKGGKADAFSVNWSLVDKQAEAILSDSQMTLIKTIEPGGEGGRFESEWNKLMIQAQNDDRANGSASAVPGPGG